MYASAPPMISDIMVRSPGFPAVDSLKPKQQLIMKLRDNLTQAQSTTKTYADPKRSEKEILVEDRLNKNSGPKAAHSSKFHLVTPGSYIKLKPLAALHTRPQSRNDDVITQWKIPWQILNADPATLEDKLSIRSTSQASISKPFSNDNHTILLVGKKQLKGEGLSGP
jgi:hypothetical protein